MTRSFLLSILTLGVLVILLLVCSINVWQMNRVERRLIELDRRVQVIEKGKGVGGAGGPLAVQVGGIFGVAEPPEVTAALGDPMNLLVKDPVPVLPSEAVQGGTLNVHMGSNPKGFNLLAENGADVTELHEYITTPLIRRQRWLLMRVSGPSR